MRPRRRLTTGELGWIGLVIYVLFVDGTAWRNQTRGQYDETMSVSFGKSLKHPKHRIATIGAWVVVTAHLFWSLPLPGQRLVKKLFTGGFKWST